MNKIYFYRTSSGREIITEFIDNLDEITKGRVRNSVRILEKHGMELLKNKSVKKISRKSDLFELRIVGVKQVRLMFIAYKPKVFLIINIFIKKTQKTPIKEIKLAQKRAKEYV